MLISNLISTKRIEMAPKFAFHWHYSISFGLAQGHAVMSPKYLLVISQSLYCSIFSSNKEQRERERDVHSEKERETHTQTDSDSV